MKRLVSSSRLAAFALVVVLLIALCAGTLYKLQIIEGAAKGVPLWSHMTRVEPCGEYGAVCVDQVEISAGALTPAVMRAAEIYLKAVQKSRNRQMRKE